MPSARGDGGLAATRLTPVRTVTEMVAVLPSATPPGVTLQVALAGAPEQVKVAVPGVVAAEVSSRGRRRSGRWRWWPWCCRSR